MNFNELCTNLGITDSQSDTEQVQLLRPWFKEHISNDLVFSGSDKEQLEEYRQISEFFLSDVLPESTQNIDKPNPKFNDLSVLALATDLGFDSLIKSMSPNKALLNTANTYGMTLLHSAATGGHFYTVKTLLQLGADPHMLNKQKQSPLFSALAIPITHDDELIANKIKVFNFLKEQGVSLDNKDDSGNTVLQQMAIYNLEPLAQETLKTNPLLAYVQNNHTHYPIHTAILNNSNATAELLLKVKEGATLADSNGWTALHYAARYGDDELLEFCSKASSNINLLDSSGRSPLMLAAEAGREETVKKLIELGAKS